LVLGCRPRSIVQCFENIFDDVLAAITSPIEKPNGAGMVRLSIVPFLLMEVDASYGAGGELSWSLTKSGNEMKERQTK
jgi:hypothetical protein